MLGNIWLALDRCTSCPSASKTKWLEGGFIKHGERVDLDRVEDLLTFGRNLDFQNDFQLGPLPCLTNKRITSIRTINAKKISTFGFQRLMMCFWETRTVHLKIGHHQNFSLPFCRFWYQHILFSGGSWLWLTQSWEVTWYYCWQQRACCIFSCILSSATST